MRPRITIEQIPSFVVGTPEWFERESRYTTGTVREVSRDCRLVASKVPSLRRYVTEKLGRDWAEWCRERWNVDAEWLDAVERAGALLEGRHVPPRGLDVFGVMDWLVNATADERGLVAGLLAGMDEDG